MKLRALMWLVAAFLHSLIAGWLIAQWDGVPAWAIAYNVSVMVGELAYGRVLWLT